MDFNCGEVGMSDALRVAIATSGEWKDHLNHKALIVAFKHMHGDFGDIPAWLKEQNKTRIERGIGDVFSQFEFFGGHSVQVHTDLNGENTVTRIGFEGEFIIC